VQQPLRPWGALTLGNHLVRERLGRVDPVDFGTERPGNRVNLDVSMVHWASP
jgi:hypothetical protein